MSNIKNLKLYLILLFGVVSIILLCIIGIQSSQNKAFALEEQVNTAQSDIKVQEKRRVDLIYNLVDCVKQYDKHEAENETFDPEKGLAMAITKKALGNEGNYYNELKKYLGDVYEAKL